MELGVHRVPRLGRQLIDQSVELVLVLDPAVGHEGWSPGTVSRPEAIHAPVPPATLMASMP